MDKKYLQIQGIYKKLEKLDPKNIILYFDKPIYLRNIIGFNTDHRGSTHCHVELPMWEYYYFPERKDNHITFEELAIGFYHIKSHKWDWNYEMWSGFSVNVVTKNNIEMYEIALDFDHGS